ncbi:MAG: TonB-dependent receptor [Spongiibacteraceae bacterium]
MRKSKKMSHRCFPQLSKSPLSALAMIAFVAPAAVAAEAKPVASEAKGFDEVVVTARRRDESLESVPISVSAISAEQLNDRQVRTDSDLQLTVPGLTIRQTQGNNSLTYSIRGQSADTFSGSPSAVVAYVDEVPTSINGASTFYDLSSVQVLKGPQGTLFGRNATGGAVLYTTAKPTNTTEGLLRARAGNFDLREVEGMVNVPIVDDKVLLRAAFNTIRKDGYIHDIVTDKYLGEIGRDSGRVTLTVKPTDQLENTTMYSYTRTDGTNTGATYVYSIYTQADRDRYGNQNININSAGLASEVALQKSLGYYKTRYPYPTTHIGEDQLLVNTTTYDLADDLLLKNILGYSRGDTDSEQPALGSDTVTFATRNPDTGKAGNELEVESFSEEFQISGKALSDNLSYIAGVYLQNARTDTLWPQTYFGGVVNTTSNFRIETETRALYAQATYSLMQDLRVTAGARYTKEDISIEQLSQSANLAVPGASLKQDETFEKPSWELGLEYDLNANTLTYLKTRGSFRSGGFNGSADAKDADATGGGNKFDAETIRDIEAGLKYQGYVLDRPSRLNLALYKEWVKDVQRIEFPDPDGPGGVPSIAVTANVPEMVVKGIELETSLMPTDWLELGVAAAYTDAEFTDNQVVLFGNTFSYSPVANTPKRTWSVWGQIDLPVDANLGDLALRTELYGQSSMYFSNTADSITPDTELPSYHIVNARLSWNNVMKSQFSAALFGKNLTDEEYFVGGMPLGASLGHNAAAVGEPRTYGVEVAYRFQ